MYIHGFLSHGPSHRSRVVRTRRHSLRLSLLFDVCDIHCLDGICAGR